MRKMGLKRKSHWELFDVIREGGEMREVIGKCLGRGGCAPALRKEPPISNVRPQRDFFFTFLLECMVANRMDARFLPRRGFPGSAGGMEIGREDMDRTASYTDAKKKN
jgi:hypothetical protein